MTILIIIYIIGNLLNAGTFVLQWKRGQLEHFSTGHKAVSLSFLFLIGSFPLAIWSIINIVEKIKAIKWRKK